MITKTLVRQGVVNPSRSSKTDPKRPPYHDREGFTVCADCKPFGIIREPVRERFRLLVLLM